MTYLITLLDNNGNVSVYTGGDIHGIYHYLEMIGYPKTFTTSGQSSHHFSPSSSINNYTSYIQPFIEALHTRQNIICECCGRIGHKSDACNIRGPKFLPPSLRININQFDELHGEEPNEPPREWNIQPTASNFKSRTFTSRNNPVISDIMGRLNHNSIDNGDFKCPYSKFPVEFNSESVTDPDSTPIKSIGDDEMDHLLEFFHSEHDGDLLDFELQMLQA